jgi:hypothetical protein
MLGVNVSKNRWRAEILCSGRSLTLRTSDSKIGGYKNEAC